MKTESKQEVLKALCDALDGKLREYSFIEDVSELKLFEFKMKRWIRTSTWKYDVVYAVFPKQHVDSVVLNVAVEIALSAEDKITLDGTTISYLARTHGGSYRFPSFVFGCKRFVQEIVDDTEMALPWFGYYETPDACLKRLKEGETNMGPLKNEGATKKVADYLASIIGHKG